jgi:hypothetical protein
VPIKWVYGSFWSLYSNFRKQRLKILKNVFRKIIFMPIKISIPIFDLNAFLKIPPPPPMHILLDISWYFVMLLCFFDTVSDHCIRYCTICVVILPRLFATARIPDRRPAIFFPESKILVHRQFLRRIFYALCKYSFYIEHMCTSNIQYLYIRVWELECIEADPIFQT